MNVVVICRECDEGIEFQAESLKDPDFVVTCGKCGARWTTDGKTFGEMDRG